MTVPIAALIERAINPDEVTLTTDGRYTHPGSYGVYQLPYEVSPRSRFRHGNHPIRQKELDREFGSSTLRFLFECKADAAAMAGALNGR